MKKILEYFTYLIVFLIPLYFNSNHWSPFGSPKILLVIGASLFMLAFLAWLWVIDSDIERIKLNWLHIALCGYLAVLTLSAISGVDPANSFLGTFNGPVSLVFLYSLGIFACIIGYLAEENPKFIRKLVSISFFTGVIVALVSYSGESIISIAKDGSTLGNSSYLGAYLIFGACFGVYLLITSKKYLWKGIIALGILAILFSPAFFNQDILRGIVPITEALHHPLLLLGSAMGATLGLGLALLFAFCMWLIRSRRTSVKIAGVVFFLVIISATLFSWYQLVTPGSAIHEAYVTEKSANRFLFWDIANSGFLEHPALGWGLGNYSDIYQKYLSSDLFRRDHIPELWVNQPHNIVYEYLSTTGILGLVAFFSLLGLMLVIFFKMSTDDEGKINYLAVMMFGLLLGNFVQDLFVFDTSVTYLMFFLVLGIGMVNAPELYSISIPFKNFNAKKVIASIVTIFCVFGLLVFAVLPWQESEQLGSAINTKNVAKIPSLVEEAEKVSIMGNIKDTAYLGDNFFDVMDASLGKINDTNRALASLATKAMANNLENQLKDEPNNFRANLVVGKLLNLYLIINGKPDAEILATAKKYLETARNLSPENVPVYLLLSQNAFIGGDLNQARTYLRASIAIAPEYLQTYQFADKLDAISPDKNFEDYVKTMKERWKQK